MSERLITQRLAVLGPAGVASRERWATDVLQRIAGMGLAVIDLHDLREKVQRLYDDAPNEYGAALGHEYALRTEGAQIALASVLDLLAALPED